MEFVIVTPKKSFQCLTFWIRQSSKTIKESVFEVEYVGKPIFCYDCLEVLPASLPSGYVLKSSSLPLQISSTNSNDYGGIRFCACSVFTRVWASRPYCFLVFRTTTTTNPKTCKIYKPPKFVGEIRSFASDMKCRENKTSGGHEHTLSFSIDG